MEKTLDLKLEIVRFGAEDVIATSGGGAGGGGSSGLQDHAYFTTLNEWRQAFPDSTDYKDAYLIFNGVTLEHIGEMANLSYVSSFPYAWYNQNGTTWGTDEQLASWYTTLPTGNDN